MSVYMCVFVQVPEETGGGRYKLPDMGSGNRASGKAALDLTPDLSLQLHQSC